MQSRDIDRSIYYDADENEQEPPLASSKTKLVTDKNVKQLIDGIVDEIVDRESNVSHSKKRKSPVSSIRSKK